MLCAGEKGERGKRSDRVVVLGLSGLFARLVVAAMSAVSQAVRAGTEPAYFSCKAGREAAG